MPTAPAREFRGRDAEIALIRNELDRVSGGAETVVIIEGAAGMGMSRLLAEIATIAADHGITTACQAHWLCRWRRGAK